MKRIFVLGMLMVLGLVTSASAGTSEDAKLDEFFRRYLDEYFRQQPSNATGLGDHRFDAKLEDLSAESRAKWIQRTRRALADLPRAVDCAQLSRAGQVDFEIFKHDLEKALWLDENTRPFEEDPRTYTDYINGSVYVLLTQSTLPKETNLANAIARMRQIPRLVAVARQTVTHPPRSVLETAIAQNLGSIDFYDKEIFELAGERPQKDALKKAAEEVVVCLKGYQEFLEKEVRPRANGQWRLGKEKFAKKLELELDAGLTADQVLAAAEADFIRVERELYLTARQLWGHYYPLDPLPPDNTGGHRSAIRGIVKAVEKEHSRPEDLTRDARATVERIRRFIRDHKILRLPDPDRCQVIEMPEFKRGNSTAYMDAAPPLDAAAQSFYAVSPPPKDWDAVRVRSLLEEYNRHMLQVLTIHEAYPGHYVQLEYANRNPSLIRRVLGSGVYIEGWAVYTEQMMLDQGYGYGDLALRLMQLKFQLRAVTNSILDHKMHCSEMTDEEALSLLVDQAYQSEGEARLKIIRAKQSSCQLSTYYVGRTAMCRLRESIQTEMGDKFDLGRYHEAVLDQGSVPVKYLPELVRQRLMGPR
ncbi:MAG: DUF885 domain-containing protein [Thermoguttaceae bacterium]